MIDFNPISLSPESLFLFFFLFHHFPYKYVLLYLYNVEMILETTKIWRVIDTKARKDMGLKELKEKIKFGLKLRVKVIALWRGCQANENGQKPDHGVDSRVTILISSFVVIYYYHVFRIYALHKKLLYFRTSHHRKFSVYVFFFFSFPRFSFLFMKIKNDATQKGLQPFSVRCAKRSLPSNSFQLIAHAHYDVRPTIVASETKWDKRWGRINRAIIPPFQSRSDRDRSEGMMDSKREFPDFYSRIVALIKATFCLHPRAFSDSATRNHVRAVLPESCGSFILDRARIEQAMYNRRK